MGIVVLRWCFRMGVLIGLILLLGADWQGSRTRRMTLEDVDDAVDPVHSIGVYTGYFNIHQKPQEGDYKSNNTKNENKREEYNATAYLAAQNRGIITRQHTPHKHQLYLFCSADASAHLLQSQPPATATSTTKSKR